MQIASRSAVSHPSPHRALELTARLGFVARGVVYLIIGGLAFLAGFYRGGATTDSRGALQVVLAQPFGKVLLAAVALGLAGYGLWKIVMGIRDPEREGVEGSAVLRRAGYVVSGLANLLLAAAAASLLLPGVIPSGGSGSGDGGTQGWTATLMAQPYGRWLVMALGLIVIGVAIAFAVRAIRASFEDELDPQACTPTIRNLCRLGIIARAIVFAIIGFFLVVAGWQSDASEVKGFSAALDAVRAQPYGEILLGVVGFGLVLFAFFSFVAARYRRIRTG